MPRTSTQKRQFLDVSKGLLFLRKAQEHLDQDAQVRQILRGAQMLTDRVAAWPNSSIRF